LFEGLNIPHKGNHIAFKVLLETSHTNDKQLIIGDRWDDFTNIAQIIGFIKWFFVNWIIAKTIISWSPSIGSVGSSAAATPSSSAGGARSQS
jgi:hypothetical protein